MSKKVCLCGSFRFFNKMLEIEEFFIKKGIVCYMPRPFNFRDQKQPCYFEGDWGSLTYEEKLIASEKAEKKYLQKIEQGDFLFVINPAGYVGPSVLFEIGYAIAKGKEVYSLEPIQDYCIMGLVEKTITPEALAKLLASH
jgi:nucleoside 2-deoxyribosyltransferase